MEAEDGDSWYSRGPRLTSVRTVGLGPSSSPRKAKSWVRKDPLPEGLGPLPARPLWRVSKQGGCRSGIDGGVTWLISYGCRRKGSSRLHLNPLLGAPQLIHWCCQRGQHMNRLFCRGKGGSKGRYLHVYIYIYFFFIITNIILMLFMGKSLSSQQSLFLLLVVRSL